MSPLLALIPANLYDRVTSPSKALSSDRIDAPPPRKSPWPAVSFLLSLLPPLVGTEIRVSPPSSAPILNAGLTSTAYDGAEASASTSTYLDLAMLFPPLVCKAKSRYVLVLALAS